MYDVVWLSGFTMVFAVPGAQAQCTPSLLSPIRKHSLTAACHPGPKLPNTLLRAVAGGMIGRQNCASVALMPSRSISNWAKFSNLRISVPCIFLASILWRLLSTDVRPTGHFKLT